MAKRQHLNKLEATAKEIAELREKQEANELVDYNRIEAQLTAIQSNEDKIKYLREEKIKYLMNLPGFTFAVSGVISKHMPSKTELFLDRFISLKIEEIERTFLKPVPPKIKAPTIALFCNLINECSIIERGINESVRPYCKRVCNDFDLPFTERVRQTFFKSDSKANRQKIREQILPNIDRLTSQKITDYLDSKNLPKQKLYG